jgi:hypothetical protein
MVNLTLALPKEMKSEMDAFPEINWSEVARQAIAQKLRDLRFLKRMKSESTLTEEDAVALGRKVNRALAKRYLERD